MDDQTIKLNVAMSGKSIIVAYLLWWFLGAFGIHRFYLGKPGTGFTQLLLLVAGVATAVFVIGYLFLLALFVWWALDAYFIHKIVHEANAEIGLSTSSISLSKSGNMNNELDQLEKLHSLFEKGVITQDQYETKKASLI